MATVSVITGAGSGIGQALAIALAERGQSVLAIGRRKAALDETRSHFPDRISVLAADITEPRDRERIADACWSFEGVAHLIHNAGVGGPIGPLTSITLDAWKKAFATNVEAPVFLTQILLPQLSGGRVLQISSKAAHLPFQACMTYCTTKAALYMIYEALRVELNAKNIAVGSVMPGIVDTGMQKWFREHPQLSESDRAFYQNVVSQGNLIPPATCARFLAWVLCDISTERYSEQEWDIYDQSHHPEWGGNVHL